MLNPDDPKPLKDCKINSIPTVEGDTPLFDILNIFQEGRSHMAVVVNKENPPKPIGIITLEDVLEELIQEEIYDESDMRVGLAVKLDTGDQLILASKKRRASVPSKGKSKYKHSHPISRANTDSAINPTIDLPGDDNKKNDERDLIDFNEPLENVISNYQNNDAEEVNVSVSEPTSPITHRKD
jgi:hypothetical protein